MFDSERFWSKVKIAGPDECWLWQASYDKDGYGQYFYNNKRYLAHIVAFAIHVGIVPNGQVIIRHTCNNPSCVNPSHLIDGTHNDNKYDSIIARTYKGNGGLRHSGETHASTLLTEDDIKEIRRLGLLMSTTQIANEPRFKGKITRGGVWHILSNSTWKGV